MFITNSIKSSSLRSWVSSVSTMKATGWTMGVQFLAGAVKECFFATASRPAPEPTHPPIQWVSVVLSGDKPAGAWS